MAATDLASMGETGGITGRSMRPILLCERPGCPHGPPIRAHCLDRRAGAAADMSRGAGQRGGGVGLELVEPPPFLPRIPRPQRAAFAALPMWALWASAYIMGFSGTAWFSALAHTVGHGLGTVADQEIAAGLLWAIPGLCFVPVVYFSALTWLRDSADPDEELRGIPEGRRTPGLPRPPRGWRLPPPEPRQPV